MSAESRLTVDELIQILVQAAVPLEVLSSLERYKPWLSVELQVAIDQSVRQIREAVLRYNREKIIRGGA